VEINPQFIPAIIAGIFGFISGLLTHYLANKRTISELKRGSFQLQLDKVYIPITCRIDSNIEPTYGYEGLTEIDISFIEKICNDNSQLIDKKLKILINRLVEDKYINIMNESSYSIYDEDRKFLRYVFYKYNLLRKKLQLPYERTYFIIPSLFLRIKDFSWRYYRKFKRRLSKLNF
jgi:hypothetical protein